MQSRLFRANTLSLLKIQTRSSISCRRLESIPGFVISCATLSATAGWVYTQIFVFIWRIADQTGAGHSLRRPGSRTRPQKISNRANTAGKPKQTNERTRRPRPPLGSTLEHDKVQPRSRSIRPRSTNAARQSYRAHRPARLQQHACVRQSPHSQYLGRPGADSDTCRAQTACQPEIRKAETSQPRLPSFRQSLVGIRPHPLLTSARV